MKAETDEAKADPLIEALLKGGNIGCKGSYSFYFEFFDYDHCIVNCIKQDYGCGDACTLATEFGEEVASILNRFTTNGEWRVHSELNFFDRDGDNVDEYNQAETIQSVIIRYEEESNA